MAPNEKAAAQAAQVAQALQSNPYIQRLIDDEGLRGNIRSAVESSRSAYGRLSNGKAPARALIENKKLHKDLREAASSFKQASDSLRQSPRKSARKAAKRGRGVGRTLAVGVVGAGLAVALNENLRSKLLDRLFGAEEEFDYTSTTTPAPAPTTGAAA